MALETIDPPQVTSQDLIRFWAKVTIGDFSECWDWKGYIGNRGYGKARIRSSPQYLAHRLAYYFTFNHWPVPCACHKCDRPACCNPFHVFEGTQKDNRNDAGEKHRLPKGERNGNAKLTENEVKQILVRNREGALDREIAAEFDISIGQANKIHNRRVWKWVGTDPVASPSNS
jgi:hypothetical protein